MFDPQDYFKGNYHKDKKVIEVDYPTLPTGLDFDDIGVIGQVYHSKYGWIDPDLAKHMNILDELCKSEERLNHLLNEENKQIDICDHDPVDVGFSKPKLVCKKCDKDL